MTKNDRREADGRYGYSNMDLPCRCGHTLGVHAGSNPKKPRPCFNDDSYVPGATGESCACENFRRAR